MKRNDVDSYKKITVYLSIVVFLSLSHTRMIGDRPVLLLESALQCSRAYPWKQNLKFKALLSRALLA